MAALYKLTDQNAHTRGGLQWGPGVTHTARGRKGQPLCTNGWIHAYEHQLLALLLNPIHGKYDPCRLWEAEGVIGLRDGWLKCGCRSLSTVREIDVLPSITMHQRARFSVGCAWAAAGQCGQVAVARLNTWREWAIGWLVGSDCTNEAAASATRAADAASDEAQAAWAADAAWAAAWAAAYAARAAAYAAADTADAASYVARAAAYAAFGVINLPTIAEWAVGPEIMPTWE